MAAFVQVARYVRCLPHNGQRRQRGSVRWVVTVNTWGWCGAQRRNIPNQIGLAGLFELEYRTSSLMILRKLCPTPKQRWSTALRNAIP